MTGATPGCMLRAGHPMDGAGTVRKDFVMELTDLIVPPEALGDKLWFRRCIPGLRVERQ